ncbi:bicaudal D-related protein homolog [Periplaneta americana]|uniref:bicaudal D-related protein homolog n=1 Tax=Periplaneta americana TaxID=6978 RepID=UPI0037E9C69D
MMHRDRMKPKYALEDYIYEMESRSLEPSADPEDLDVYAQLQQKEKDLILAAELGKALLEKNEELSRQNEKIAEDFSQKLELLEQDRHSLRRKLESTQSECDTRLLELQTDLRELTKTLADRETTLKQTEREKTTLITELTEQNQRLTNQLKESSRVEEQLTVQLQGLRDQCNLKKSSLQDHMSSLEVLRDEIHLMSEKKCELERRLQSLLSEREGLGSALDEATDRIVMLEHQAREQEIQLRQAQREVEELRATNGNLGERIEMLSAHSSSPGPRSLLHEMECDDTSSESELIPHSESNMESLDGLRKEVLSAYKQLRTACDRLRHSRGDSISSDVESMPSEDLSPSKLKVGLLSEIVKELSKLIQDVLSRRESRPSSSSSSGIDLELELEAELHRANESLEKVQRQLDEREEELKRKSEQIMELTSKLSVRDAELTAMTEERDRARNDVEDTHLARDEVVRKAWEVRDAAVARKNNVEVELAKTRIDVMQANSQLMEAIQQKVELSQQLEQWQMDMQSLLDDQMKRKLCSQERARQAHNLENSKRPSTRRLFGLFQR